MITDEQIVEIIRLTADVEATGEVWGMDTEIAHIDDLIKDVRKIIEKRAK